jgi:hypothetical protein
MTNLLERVYGSSLSELTRLLIEVLNNIQAPFKAMQTPEAKQAFDAQFEVCPSSVW